MKTNTVVRSRIEEQTKEDAAAVLQSMGLTLSDFVRMSLIYVAREKTVPSEFFTPNETTIKAIKAAREGKVESFASVDDMLKSLHAKP